MVAAAAVVLSGLGLSGATAAHAEAPAQQQYVFTDPNGTDWRVPDGITEVIVGIRGGSGGDGDVRTGGSGASFAVKVPVTGGDILTVYAGQNAHGKHDYREGGAGFIKGGTGGKGSLIAEHGGGGGGAGAVKLNGELLAVAGGGGGGGGATASPTVKGTLLTLLTLFEAAGGYDSARRGDGDFKYVPGGVSGSNWGSAPESGKTTPTAGSGSAPGAPGVNGTNSTSSPGYHKAGSDGGTAGTGTIGGGGGGGGGGWPASGSGGGGGRKFWHFSGGSGGGAGMSWVTDKIPGVEWESAAYWPEDVHVYEGPMAESNTAKIFIPMTSTTEASAPARVLSNESIPLRVRTWDNRPGNKPIDGFAEVYLDGEKSRVDFQSIGGDYTFRLPGRPAGTYTFRVDFVPRSEQRYYKQKSTYSSDTVTVEVVDPTPEPVDPTAVTSDTTAVLSGEPLSYGDVASLSGVVELSESGTFPPAFLNFEIDGEMIPGDFELSQIGETTLTTISGPRLTLPAGSHRVVATFPGAVHTDPGVLQLLPSDSVPVDFTIAKAASSATISEVNGEHQTSDPLRLEAFTPVAVTGQITSPSAIAPSGEAVLLAGDQPVATAALNADGTVQFDAVSVPSTTSALSIAYYGDAGGNFESANSQSYPLEFTDVPTSTELEVFDTDVRADQTVRMTATVKGIGAASAPDPRGTLEILFDGEVVESVSAGLDTDEDQNNDLASYSIEISDLPLGSHQVSARFVAATGFSGSASDETELRVRGIETVLTPSATTITGNSKQLDTFTVTAQISDTPAARSASAAPATTPVSGYVQAYLGREPLGSPFMLEQGTAEITLPGLAVGTHEIELQFVPETQGMLKASALVQATVTADSGESGGQHGAKPGTLSNTGGADPLPVVFGAAALLLAAGAVILVANRRRHQQR